MYRLRDGKYFKCPACKKLLMMITDTLFGGSPVKLLPKWFVAIWIETNHRKGMSSVQLAKLIGTWDSSSLVFQAHATLYQSRLIPYQQDKQSRASDDCMG